MWAEGLRFRWPRPNRSRSGDVGQGNEVPEDAESAHEDLRIAFLLQSWRRTAVPTREEASQLRAALAGRVPEETFATPSPDLVAEVDVALATGEGIAACLRRGGMGLGYPRSDVALSLAWLAAGEGDALARVWLASALCRADPEEGPVNLALVAEHLESAGLARMSYDANGLAAGGGPGRGGGVGAAGGRPGHAGALRAQIDATAALRMDPGWRNRLSDARARAEAATGASVPSSPVEDDLDFLSTVEPIPTPQPPRPAAPTAFPDAPVRDVAPGFSASQPHLRLYARLERALPLLPSANPVELERALLEDFPWLSEPIRHVARSQLLRARGSTPWFGFRPMLLVGDVGLGKTRFARTLSNAAGVPLKVFNAAGQSGSIEILGHSPTYREAHASAPVSAMTRLGVANPLILIDEVDKFGTSDWNGSPHDALLPMLDPESAVSFHDEFLRLEVDVSQVGYVLTANSTEGLSRPLLDRLDVFHVQPPTRTQLAGILPGLVAETAAEFGLGPDEAPPLDPAFLDGLGGLFERGASIRRVRRAVRNALMAGAGHAPH
jgi:hypothetical protein